MVTFTKSSGTSHRKWNKYVVPALKVLLALIFLNFVCPQLSAQIIKVDGDPSDWAAALKSKDPSIIAKTFRHDANNTNDDQWTGGSADPDMVSNWYWIKGNTNDKGDITNAGAILVGKTIYFFGDRTAVNGDAQIGFWFFLGGISPSGAGDVRSGFAGTNVDGDILAISNFTNGGGTAAPTIYKRQGNTLVVDNSAKALVATNKDKQKQYVPSGVSVGDPDWPFNESWTFTPKSGGTAGEYPDPLFFEGYIDFSSETEANLCFTNFLLETRNSQSLKASLQDFVAGSFDVTPKPPTAGADPVCYGNDLVFTATCSSNGSSPRWYTNATGGAPLTTTDGVSSDGSTLTVKGLSKGSYDYYVSCYNATLNCESARTKVTGVVNQVTCTTTWISDVTCYGLADGSAKVNPAGGSGDYSYLWDNNETTQTATKLTGSVAGLKHTVTVTDNVTKCTTTCDVTIKQPEELKATCSVTKAATCAGNDGEITAYPTGGTAPYSYSLNGGTPQSSAVFGGLVPGQYTITVTDKNNCTATTGTCEIVGVSCAHIFPTQTTCCNYLGGTTANFQLKQVCTTLDNTGKVTNAIPGVFFYYGDYTATADGPITLYIVQQSAKQLFNVQNSSNVMVYVDNCQGVAETVAVNGGNASVNFTAIKGKKYVISAKYDVKSIIGFRVPNGTVYSFGLSLNGTDILGNSAGQVIAVSGCSDNTPTPSGTCPAPTQVNPQTLPVDQVSIVSDLTVNAQPNPYNDKVRFSLQSPVSGQGSLEVFNLLGQKVATVFQGFVEAGQTRTVEYTVPDAHRTNLIYMFSVGDHRATGKLLH